MLSIEDFKDKHRGESVALLCNGPSLNNFDLTKLPIRAIGMHGSWRKLVTEYHVHLIHKQYFDEIKDGLWKPDIIFVQNFHPEYYKAIHSKTVIVERGDKPKNKNFSFDLAKKGSSIVHCGLFALEIVIWMGFHTIYIFGLDLNRGEHHFYGASEFQKWTTKDEMRDFQVSLWQSCADQIRQHKPHVKIYNCNPNSRVTAFETRTPWDCS
jgi:hypothetical protein